MSPEDPVTSFADLGLREELVARLVELDYEEPTPIQREAIPVLIEGSDLLGQAATGTGKTAAFALPLLHRLGDVPATRPTALILVPTRELAMQVQQAVSNYGRSLGVRVVAVFGGQPIQRQLKSIERGAHIVVATPGRAIDLINRRSLKLDAITTVVLDEADEMLDMGFTDDIETILEHTPSERQTVLFSATLPRRITAIAERHQRDPKRITIKAGDVGTDSDLVRQTAYVVDRHHKAAALGRILDVEAATSAIVFCRTRAEVDELTVTMNSRNHRAEALHGGMDQEQRDRVMGRLRDGTAELLIATDVAARGLDVDTLTHVVNYDVPAAPEAYVHRIGRVGRAGRTGTAITLVEPRQRRLLENIERLTKQRLEVARIPSVDDLRATQIERTAEALEAVLVAGDIDEFGEVLEALDEFDDRSIALAAIKLLREAEGSVDETEIPSASMKGPKGGKGGKDKGSWDKGAKGKPAGRSDRGRRTPDGPTGSVYVNLGSKAGVRPADLVGAIANEAGIPGREVGPIRIGDTYAVVGVPEGAVEDVIKALNKGSVRGKPVKARRFVE
ncbi:DEAD/DEAH box helicase [Acidimicrobiia bacterium EGI L10123]|uniref:DEAD/DEAH box helicase n=1 Tax=Salinilacustrithrix flava TaxID=2957203 RepID=UPI003D7C3294|nr:DEAD/DEAH box helicase [Acidimicrobiia bacterium EGI L10123]